MQICNADRCARCVVACAWQAGIYRVHHVHSRLHLPGWMECRPCFTSHMRTWMRCTVYSRMLRAARTNSAWFPMLSKKPLCVVTGNVYATIHAVLSLAARPSLVAHILIQSVCICCLETMAIWIHGYRRKDTGLLRPRKAACSWMLQSSTRESERQLCRAIIPFLYP